MPATTENEQPLEVMKEVPFDMKGELMKKLPAEIVHGEPLAGGGGLRSAISQFFAIFPQFRNFSAIFPQFFAIGFGPPQTAIPPPPCHWTCRRYP